MGRHTACNHRTSWVIREGVPLMGRHVSAICNHQQSSVIRTPGRHVMNRPPLGARIWVTLLRLTRGGAK